MAKIKTDKTIFKLMKLPAVVLLVICLVAAGAILVKHKKKELADTPGPPEMPLPVMTAQVKLGSLSETRRYLGTLEAKTKADISPMVTAQLLKLYAREGDLVKKGQLLAVLDSRIQNARIRSLEAQLKAAKTAFLTYQGIYQRDFELHESKALSTEALDRSKMALESARARVSELSNLLDSARVELSYTRINAPFQGIVSKRFLDEGDMALSGRPIMTLEATTGGYKLVLKIPQAVFPLVEKGMDATILSSNGYESIKARISRLYPSSDLPCCDIDLDQRPFKLPTGSRLYVEIGLRKASGIILPSMALLEQAKGPELVFALDNENHVGLVPVKVLVRNPDLVCVSTLQGKLTLGQRVVVAGEDVLLRLKNGQKVWPYPSTSGKEP